MQSLARVVFATLSAGMLAAQSTLTVGPSGYAQISDAVAVALTVPFAAQPIHFDPTAAVAFSYGLINTPLPWPGSGFYTWQTGTLTASMTGMKFWLHPLVWDSATFQVGPTSGGVVY